MERLHIARAFTLDRHFAQIFRLLSDARARPVFVESKEHAASS